MSFKREGNDKSQLNILKKRRVADLLSNFIPDDEAALMSNGRFTCLVCFYRPVFDTVEMLTVHRQGRKHLDGLKGFYGKKQRLKNEIRKSQHENYVKAEDAPEEPSSSAPLLVQTRKLTHHALLKTVPYNSCHRKTSTKSEEGPQNTSKAPPGNICNKMASSCGKVGVSNDLTKSSSSDTNTGKLFPWKSLTFGLCLRKIKKCFKGGFVCCSEESGCSKDVEALPAAETAVAEPMTAQRRRELEHYLKLKSDGWVQDWTGQWVKDDSVEFDSDEEEPASLAPLPTSP
ncbi:LOW QUALITY PROTEIN: sodium channel modifier 1 [Cololabis saira]|uniref:LOW QUALITY PROTEIN: sodium channel modifier 1 n=1 Tax=Cololabis saira TaxID=129043 RepID=UPI002AD2C659|nr:LOW QUALITY PROTEIN: sodium channel modifier 1 [Cololabis saira]